MNRVEASPDQQPVPVLWSQPFWLRRQIPWYDLRNFFLPKSKLLDQKWTQQKRAKKKKSLHRTIDEFCALKWQPCGDVWYAMRRGRGHDPVMSVPTVSYNKSVEDSKHFHPLRSLLEHPLPRDQHHGVGVLDLLARGRGGGGSSGGSGCGHRLLICPIWER